MLHRINAVRDIISEKDIEGMLIDSGVSRFYLTGFTGTAGKILFTPDENFFLTDFRYKEQAQAQTEGYEIKEINSNQEENIYRLLQQADIKKLGFEADQVSYSQVQKYKEAFTDIELVPIEDLVPDLRLSKDESEVKKIETAIDIAEAAFDHILEFIEPGLREKEVALELEYYMKKNGGSAKAFDLIVASGLRSSMPHGVASDKKIVRGDLVTIDFGTVFEGYNSDLTRTFVVGRATDKMREIYELVLKAQMQVISKIKPGMTGREIDKVARDIIEEAGYGDYFGHGLGHGLGIEVHEEPRLSPTSETVLKPGMVVTDEPGIYIPEWGGVRIEDDLLITKSGCRILSGLDKGLIEL